MCEACGEHRVPRRIAVHRVDLGEELGLPGLAEASRGIRYCADRTRCYLWAVSRGERDRAELAERVRGRLGSGPDEADHHRREDER
jgi:hypothetical protein